MKYDVREDSQRLDQFSRKHHFLPVVRITSIIFHTHVYSGIQSVPFDQSLGIYYKIFLGQ